MKLIFFLLLIAFYFSFASSMHLFTRSLASNKNKQLLIIGFGGYKNLTDGRNGNKQILIYFKRYYNNFNINSPLYLTPTIDYNNGTKNLKVNISCKVNGDTNEIYSFFNCTLENRNESHFIELIQLNDFNFRNESRHTIISADEIELNYLAESTKNNVQNQIEELNLMVFDLKGRDISKDKVLLYGNLYENLDSSTNLNLSEHNWTLYLSENIFECGYHYNFSQDKNSFDAISFLQIKILMIISVVKWQTLQLIIKIIIF